MIPAVVRWAIQNRLIVFLLAGFLVLVGGRAAVSLPIDAVPDVTNVQVQVLTSAPGLSPLEVEQLVTRPVELSMSGLPGTQVIRSVSRPGVSAVTIVFDDHVDLSHARSVVSQRLPNAREAIPPGVGRPEMGPLTTGLGEVFQFTVTWPGHSPAEIRTLLDWEIARGLRSVPGVVEVNAWGGDTRQVEVLLRPSALRALGVSQEDVEHALLSSGTTLGAAALVRGEEQFALRVDGQYRTLADVADQVVSTKAHGVPVRVADVAFVREGTAFRTSAATADGSGDVVYAMVQMVASGNAHEIVARVKERVAEISKRLPEGAKIDPFYDRSDLVGKVIKTVERSLLEGGLIVIIVLFLFLGDVRAGLLVSTAIPLSMLGAFALMKSAHMSGNLMSLGAIDFGLVVDGAVVMVEGALAAIARDKLLPRDAIVAEAKGVGREIAFGVFIIAFVYVPVLLLEGTEGKMFRPMGITVLFALLTALVLTFTWIPALGSLVLSKKAHEKEPLVIRGARRVFSPVSSFLLSRPKLAMALSVVLVAVGAAALWGRGVEFVPRLEEGDLVVQVTRPPSVSLAEANQGTRTLEVALLAAAPEVTRVVSRTGSPDVATDVMGIEQSDVFIILKPRGKWRKGLEREKLVAELEVAARAAVPGTVFGFTQPIEMRANELLGGMKSDVGVKIHGDDLAVLDHLGADLVRAASQIRGAADVRMEALSGLPIVTIRPNPGKMGRLGVKADDVRALVETLRAGRPVGTLVEGERRFQIVLRREGAVAPDVPSLRATTLSLGDGRTVTLGDLCDISLEEGPAQISREQARRRVMIEMNVRGRDLGAFVSDLRREVDKQKLPAGYYVTMSGQFENLVSATKTLAMIVPATLGTIFVLLFLTFGSARPAVLIFLNIPIATSGGLVALAVRGLPLSISAAVGMIALFGVATLNGVVLLAAAGRHVANGEPRLLAAERAAGERLRPVLTTAVVASLGFIPMALSTGVGSEVQRPLATVVIGGLVTATLLTLGILPSLYARFGGPHRDSSPPSKGPTETTGSRSAAPEPDLS